MRPAKTSQSVIMAPLNRIFGTEANVRVLRVLSLSDKPLGRPQVAQRAQMDPSGVRRALDSLATEGIVEGVGSGGRMPMRLRDAHPLAGSLRALFKAERTRAEALFHAVRDAVESLSTRPEALWTVLVLPRQPEQLEVVRVGLVAGVREVDGIARELRRLLREVERSFDVPIEVMARTAPDMQTLPAAEAGALGEARPVVGPAPASFLPPVPPAPAPAAAPPRTAGRTHADLDRRGLALGRAIGDRVVRDPRLIARARDYVRRQLSQAAPGVRLEMEEWDGILDTMPPARLRAFLSDPGQRATRLRQSLPFLDVLTQQERTTVFKEAGR